MNTTMPACDTLKPRRARPLLLALMAWAASANSAAQTTTATEESNSPGVYQIKAPAMYGLGVTGLNVTMAIIDTGIMVKHHEFGSRVLTGFNAFNGTTNANDDNGHGTHVAGISGAGFNNPSTSGMFGVAYDAYLLPIKVLDKRGSGSWETVARGIQYAVNQRNSLTLDAKFKPFVINLSLGGSSTSTSATVETSLRNAVSAGMVVVAAAGNDGGANPIYPARYAKETTWANGQIIAVGAVGANNVIASWSNRAGDTKDFYLVAPGVSIYSTYTKWDPKTKKYLATYATLSGTSMATPYVTGAVALIKSGWSYLTAPQITSILFESATDLGDPAIYGHGLLNLQDALAPIGRIEASTSSGKKVAVSGTSLTGTGATGTALQAAGRAGLLKVAAFDSYGRDYQVDLAPALTRNSSSADGIAAMLAAVDAADQRVVSRQGLMLRASYQGEATRLALGPSNGNAWSRDGGFTLSTTDAAQREVVFGTSGMAASAFGLAGELARLDQAPLAATLSNPYFALAQQHLHAGVGWPVGDGLRVKFGMLASAPQTGVAEAASRRSPLGQSMLLAELAGRRDALLWSLGFGQLREAHSVLGTTQTGALALAGQARTNVLNFGLALPVSSQATFALQYSMGSTGAVQNQAASIVTGYSGIRSNAFSATLALAHAFRAGDQLSVTLGQPMRVQSGSMGMAMSVGVDADGTPVMGSRSISLRPSGRETRADILYLSPLDRHAKWFLGISVRNQPDHDRAATRETIIGAGIRATF